MTWDVAAIASLANIVVTCAGFFFFLMSVMNKQAVQGALLASLSKQLANLQRTVEEMRRGDGWIQAPRRSHVDGEY
jgi:Tfp pilus assembly protein PilN